jgi:glycosyltransferase involved in cell wall biosynthesis
MKISVIGPTYPYKGGISHFTTILVRHLRKDNQVNFISWKRQYPAFLYPVELKDTQSKNPIKEEAKFILDFYNPLSWIKAFIEIRKDKSELLVLNWVSPIQAPIYFAITFLVKLFSRTKVLYVCHNVLPHEAKFLDKPFLKLAFSQADSCIVHSRDDGEILKSLVKGKKIIQGFLPIFDMFPKPAKFNKDEFKKKFKLKKRVLLFFGYIRPYKGLKYLLQAMPKIINDFKDTSLLVVGEFWSKDKQSYLDLVKELGIYNNVAFQDKYVPNEELGKYFAVSDVVVLPYLSATQSAAVQTAYAFDKPVIATNVGGLKDVILDGKTGYFIHSKDFEDIFDKVEKFYEKEISTQQVSKYKDNWSWDKYNKLLVI